jgi:hypothetical protein
VTRRDNVLSDKEVGGLSPDCWPPEKSIWLGRNLARRILYGSTVAALALGMIPKPLGIGDTTSAGADSHPHPSAKSSALSGKTPLKRLKINFPSTVIDYANEPSGYARGNIITGDTVIDSGIKEKDHHKRNWRLLRVLHRGNPTDDECAWAKSWEIKRAGRLNRIEVKYQQDICKDKVEEMTNRDSFGREWPCPPHVCDDGDPEPTAPEVKYDLFLNYDEKLGKAYDKIAPLEFSENFKVRYTSLDRQKSWGRATFKVLGKRYDIWMPIGRGYVLGKYAGEGGAEIDYGPHADK